MEEPVAIPTKGEAFKALLTMFVKFLRRPERSRALPPNPEDMLAEARARIVSRYY